MVRGIPTEEQLAGVLMVAVVIPTTDVRTLVLIRDTQPEAGGRVPALRQPGGHRHAVGEKKSCASRRT